MAEHKGFQDLVADAKKKITEISPTDAASKAKSSDAVIVDVREKDEFDESHIPDAVHMSRGMLELEIEDKFPDRNTTIICHCRRRRTIRARGGEPAKDGLQKRPFHGRRLQSVESRRTANDEIVFYPPTAW